MDARASRGLFDYSRKLPTLLVFALATVVLYAPIAVLVMFSFNDATRGGNVIWRGFTTDWYVEAFNNEELQIAFANSLTIAAVSTLFSVILGALAAFALWRFRIHFKPLFDGALTLPIVIPEICMGVSLAMFYATTSFSVPSGAPWPLSLTEIIIAHITFSFPFAAMIVRARLTSFNRELAEAARDLGATELRVIIDTVVPHVAPALIASALLCATLSLDDFVVTFFTAGPETVTFPVKVYSMVRFSVTPEVNAASTVLIIATLMLTGAGIWLYSRPPRP